MWLNSFQHNDVSEYRGGWLGRVTPAGPLVMCACVAAGQRVPQPRKCLMPTHFRPYVPFRSMTNHQMIPLGIPSIFCFINLVQKCNSEAVLKPNNNALGPEDPQGQGPGTITSPWRCFKAGNSLAKFWLDRPRDHGSKLSPFTWTGRRTSGWGSTPDVTWTTPTKFLVLKRFPGNAPFGLQGLRKPILLTPGPRGWGWPAWIFPMTPHLHAKFHPNSPKGASAPIANRHIHIALSLK